MICVYRYIDLNDNIIKYVGVVTGDKVNLASRIKGHKSDNWVYGTKWRVEYIEEDINTRTDAEMFESHFISLFGTNKWFNKSKANWGVSSFVPKIGEWSVYKEEIDYDSKREYIDILEKRIKDLKDQNNIKYNNIVGRNRKLEIINKKLRELIVRTLPFGLKTKFMENTKLDNIKDEELFNSIIEDYVKSINDDKEFEDNLILNIKMSKNKATVFVHGSKVWYNRVLSLYSGIESANIINDTDDNTILVKIPSEWIKLPKPPREYHFTEEQRNAARDRLAKARDKNKEINSKNLI